MVKQSDEQQSKQEVKVLYPKEAIQVHLKPEGVWVSINDWRIHENDIIGLASNLSSSYSSVTRPICYHLLIEAFLVQ